jgi:V/A-type H+/Na+-transporting ATPase subunit A
MMRLLGRFIDLCERAVASDVAPDRIASMACVRALQRMGEEIGDDDLAQFPALEAAMEREFGLLNTGHEESHAAHG